MDANQEVFDEDAGAYVDLALMPAERAALRRLAPRLSSIDMLDLGIGTGRTSWTFAPLVRRYVGVDYSPRMIEAARRRIGGEEGVELVDGDARDLSKIEGEFDFVLFSFNGIDAVAPEGRLEVLDQVRSKLRPEGRFMFSTHNLGALPFDTERPASPRFSGSRLYRLYAMVQAPRYARSIRAINKTLDLAEARRKGWAVVPSNAHDFRLRDYYVDPEFQVGQLREHGFEVETVYDTDGREVTLPTAAKDSWFDYFCRPVGSTG